MRRKNALGSSKPLVVVIEEVKPLAVPQLDQSLFYRNTLREFDRGPHDPYLTHRKG